MKLKKIVSVLLVAACVFSLAACGSKKDSGESEDGGKADKLVMATNAEFPPYEYHEGDEIVEQYNKGFEAVQALTQGKIDAVVIDGQPAKEFVKEAEGLKILDEAFTEEEYAIAIAKDNTELKDQINDALAKLKDSGKLDEIIGKYIKADAE